MHANARHVVPRILILAVLAALGFALWRTSGHRDDGADGLVRASGTIEATEILLAPKAAGRIVELSIDEGDSVRAGELVARLDTAELAAAARQAEAATGAAVARYLAALHGARPEQVDQARALLAQAQGLEAGARAALAHAREGEASLTDLKAQVDAAASKRDASAEAVEQARASLALTEAGARPNQIAQARSALAQADASLRKATDDLARAEALQRDGAVSVQYRDSLQTAADVARHTVEQARERLADLEAGARPDELRAARAALAQARAAQVGSEQAVVHARRAYTDHIGARAQTDSARAGLAAAQAQVRAARSTLDLLVNGTRSEDVLAAKRQADQAAAALQLSQATVRNAYVHAPVDGVITTRMAEIGETVAAGTPVAEMADLSQVWVRVFIPESSYGRVKLGMAASVLVDSYPGRSFAGKVVAISNQAEFTPRNVQTPEERARLVFAVKVAVTNSGLELKPGMPADAIIKTR